MIITFSTSFEKNSEILTWKDEVLRIFHWFRSPLMKKTLHNSHSYQNFYVENNHFPPPWITFINGVQIKSKCTKKPDKNGFDHALPNHAKNEFLWKHLGKFLLCHIPPKGFSLDTSASKILNSPKMGKKYNKELLHKF